MMHIQLKDETGAPIQNVFNVTLSHEKELPAVLTWQMLRSQALTTRMVSVWVEDEFLFNGTVNKVPLEFKAHDVVWSAVAVDLHTFHNQKVDIEDTRTQASMLTGKIAGCLGAEAGRSFIHPVTHAVEWVPLTLDATDSVFHVKMPDAVILMPSMPKLTGLSSDVRWKNAHTISGMMDVGEFITAKLPRGIETYSGAQLQAQVAKFAFKALRFGYEVQTAQLEQREALTPADRLAALSLKDGEHSIVGLPYAHYNLNMQLSWHTQVREQHALTLSYGLSDAHIQLNVREDISPPHDITDIIAACKKWMQAYANWRALTHIATAKLRVNSVKDLAHLKLGQRCCIHDARFTRGELNGIVDKYTLHMEAGVVYLSMNALIAIEPPLTIAGHAIRQNEVPLLATPKTPGDIIAYATVLNDAKTQQQYYTSQPKTDLTEFWKHFPVTQLEIGLHPICGDVGMYNGATVAYTHVYTLE